MKKTITKIMIAATLFAVTPLTLTVTSKIAHASLPVIDITNLQQNTLTALRTAAQIENQLVQIRNQVKSLSMLPSGITAPIKGVYDSNLRELNGLIADVKGIGFDLNQIDGQFNQLYPTGQWDTINRGQYDQYYQKWNTELTESARTAMKAQGVIERSQGYNTQAMNILEQSNSSDGEVRQIQATNQMLSLVSAQLSGLTENLSTSTRLTATVAVDAAQRKEAERAYRNKLMDGYGGLNTTPQPIELKKIH